MRKTGEPNNKGDSIELHKTILPDNYFLRTSKMYVPNNSAQLYTNRWRMYTVKIYKTKQKTKQNKSPSISCLGIRISASQLQSASFARLNWQSIEPKLEIAIFLCETKLSSVVTRETNSSNLLTNVANVQNRVITLL